MSITFLKTKNGTVEEIENITDDCWVDVLEPTPEDCTWLENELGIVPEFIRSAFDDEETAHIDEDDDTGQILITIDCPFLEDENEKDDKSVQQYDTHPLTFIFVPEKKLFVTVSLRRNDIVASFFYGRVSGISTARRTQFLLQMLLRVARRYLVCLRSIQRQMRENEKKLRKTMQNKELMKMLGLEKSLVYFATSLQGLESTVNRIRIGKTLDFYDDDAELLDDVLIEVRQAAEMCQIYTNILEGVMDTFSSVINNNLNSTMRTLTTITVLFTIPTIIFSFYGMNVEGLPFIESWWPAVVMAGVVVTIAAIILKTTKLLR